MQIPPPLFGHSPRIKSRTTSSPRGNDETKIKEAKEAFERNQANYKLQEATRDLKLKLELEKGKLQRAKKRATGSN